MISIPKKNSDGSNGIFNHQVRLNEDKTRKFARVREVLNGYTTNELLEILVDNVIEKYYDGIPSSEKYLPKGLSVEERKESDIKLNIDSKK